MYFLFNWYCSTNLFGHGRLGERCRQRENVPTRWRRGRRREELWPRACAQRAATAQSWVNRGRPAQWRLRKTLQAPRAMQSPPHNHKIDFGAGSSLDAGRLRNQCFSTKERPLAICPLKHPLICCYNTILKYDFQTADIGRIIHCIK